MRCVSIHLLKDLRVDVERDEVERETNIPSQKAIPGTARLRSRRKKKRSSSYERVSGDEENLCYGNETQGSKRDFQPRKGPSCRSTDRSREYSDRRVGSGSEARDNSELIFKPMVDSRSQRCSKPSGRSQLRKRSRDQARSRPRKRSRDRENSRSRKRSRSRSPSRKRSKYTRARSRSRGKSSFRSRSRSRENSKCNYRVKGTSEPRAERFVVVDLENDSDLINKSDRLLKEVEERIRRRKTREPSQDTVFSRTVEEMPENRDKESRSGQTEQHRDLRELLRNRNPRLEEPDSFNRTSGVESGFYPVNRCETQTSSGPLTRRTSQYNTCHSSVTQTSIRSKLSEERSGFSDPRRSRRSSWETLDEDQDRRTGAGREPDYQGLITNIPFLVPTLTSRFPEQDGFGRSPPREYFKSPPTSPDEVRFGRYRRDSQEQERFDSTPGRNTRFFDEMGIYRHLSTQEEDQTSFETTKNPTQRDQNIYPFSTGNFGQSLQEYLERFSFRGHLAERTDQGRVHGCLDRGFNSGDEIQRGLDVHSSWGPGYIADNQGDRNLGGWKVNATWSISQSNPTRPPDGCLDIDQFLREQRNSKQNDLSVNVNYDRPERFGQSGCGDRQGESNGRDQKRRSRFNHY